MPPTDVSVDASDEKLPQDLAPFGSECFSKSDLARPLRYGHRHDGHDADPARREARSMRGRRALEKTACVVCSHIRIAESWCHEVEIVGLVEAETMTDPHERFDRLHRVVA